MSGYVRKSPGLCKNCGGQLTRHQRNYCNECLLEYYHSTGSMGAYRSLVLRGYGGMLMLEHLAGRGHTIPKQAGPAPTDKENSDE